MFDLIHFPGIDGIYVPPYELGERSALLWLSFSLYLLGMALARQRLLRFLWDIVRGTVVTSMSVLHGKVVLPIEGD